MAVSCLDLGQLDAWLFPVFVQDFTPDRHLDGESGSHLKIIILNVLYLYNSIYVYHSWSGLGPNPDKSYFLLPLGLGPAIFNPEPNLLFYWSEQNLSTCVRHIHR